MNRLPIRLRRQRLVLRHSDLDERDDDDYCGAVDADMRADERLLQHRAEQRQSLLRQQRLLLPCAFSFPCILPHKARCTDTRPSRSETGCRSGFTESGSACVAETTTTTSVAPEATQTCSVTAECTNTIPAYANRYCDNGVCSFRASLSTPSLPLASASGMAH